MSQTRTAMLRLEGFAGGLNDTDPPHRIGDDQLAVATDVELTATGGIVRRPGTSRAMPPPLTGATFSLLQRHTPSQDLSATEVWAFPRAATAFYRSTTGTTWGSAALSEYAADAFNAVSDATSFNGKLYIAYKKLAAVDRLHVWDGTSVRRVGISTPAAPSVADTGAGSYAATPRYYKTQFYLTAGVSGANAFSDLSPAIAFTPSGTGTHARITKPATPDGATAWRVWASSDNVSYYLLTSSVVATTTVDDNTAPSGYSALNVGFVPAESGAYTPPWSAKYLLVDENRLLIAGACETARYASRIGWSSILGTAAASYGETTPVADDERFPTDNYLDLDSDEGGELTGMEMLNGSVYVFKRYAIYKLVRTGNVDVPYKPVTISKVVGALSRKSVVPGEDEAGGPCLYFLSERGPYRLGAAGLQYLGADIETLWATVNKRTGAWISPPHGVYDARQGRLYWWVTTASNGNDLRLTFHTKLGRPSAGQVRGGWTSIATATSRPMYAASSCLLPSDLSNRDSELAPHAIHTNGAFTYPPVIWKYTTSQASDDVVDATGAITGTESFAPIATTKTFSLGLGDRGGVNDVYVACTPAASSGVTLAATLSRDFGAETRSKSQAFVGTTTRMPLQIPDLTMAQAQYVSLSLTSATQAAFTVDEIALRVRREEPV